MQRFENFMGPLSTRVAKGAGAEQQFYRWRFRPTSNPGRIPFLLGKIPSMIDPTKHCYWVAVIGSLRPVIVERSHRASACRCPDQ